MPKIALLKKTTKINTITLVSREVCPIEKCRYYDGCLGKDAARDNDFVCHLQELKKLYCNADKKKIDAQRIARLKTRC